MNLKEWAQQQGIHPVTAYRWFRQGRLPVPARRVGGLILVDSPASSPPGAVAVYARVPSDDQRADLDRQVARLVAWANAQGMAVGQVVTEVGPALDGRRRRGLLTLLRDPHVQAIVVEHRDRIAPLGIEYLEATLEAQGRRLLVVDPSGGDGDLVRDVSEILVDLCARRYGRRAAAARVAKAMAALQANDGA